MFYIAIHDILVTAHTQQLLISFLNLSVMYTRSQNMKISVFSPVASSRITRFSLFLSSSARTRLISSHHAFSEAGYLYD